MKETNENEIRPAPKDWREYLSGIATTGRMFGWIWTVIPKESKRKVVPLVACLFLSTTAGLLVPRYVASFIDGATRHDLRAVLVALGMVAATMLVSRVFDYLFSVVREYILGVNWGAVDRHITEEFFGKSVGQHIQESSTLAVSNIDKGRWRLLDLEAMLLFEGIPTVISLATAFAFLSALLPLAGIAMAAGIACYGAWTVYLNRKVLVVCSPLDAEFRKLNRYRVERWEKVERVKLSTRDREEVRRTDAWFDDLIGKDRSFWNWFSLQNLWRGEIMNVCLVAILAYAVRLVWTGAWPISLVLPLFIWSAQVVDNVWRVGRIEHQLSWNAPSVRSMIDALSLEPDIRSGETPLKDEEPLSVRFESVGYAYPNEQAARNAPSPILNGIDFTIAPGEKLALLGESGAGKTTVMRLLLRYMDPTEGRILVGGRDLRDLDLETWWKRIGYIPQQPYIFDGTIRDNLTYALSETERALVTDDALWELMRLLQIDFGTRLCDGLDTLVGRNGLKLSGGQAQRLMIGAATVKRPAFMIIDEATSSLDSTTEKYVQRGLAAVLTPDVGALVVAHRLSTVRSLCDRFMVLTPTEAAEKGDAQVEAIASTFEELYEISPTFRRLANDQEVSIRPPETSGTSACFVQ